jgi:protein-S-isoprenylcysteine O-methyltransferase Ste14
MTAYFGALTIVLLFATVLTRALMMRRQGIQAMNFGKLDKTDFIIPPFALFYFYLVFANAFGWPSLTTQQFFEPETIAWLGVGLCLAGLAMLLWSLVAFGRSFRVGIDTEAPDKLVTTGVFGFSRNPIYLGFACILLGEFLIFPNWILLAYLVAGFWLLHRQVLREEAFLRQHYGQEYDEYAQRVRRYL